VTVDWAQSEVKIGALGIPATWATLGSSTGWTRDVTPFVQLER
jgi:hypothetical protein